MFPTIILRHRKENLAKCSLKGLEKREDFLFFTYPRDLLPPLSHYILLTLDAPLLSLEDRSKGIFLIDGTWNYASKMIRMLPSTHPPLLRSLPPTFLTAYPRKQTACPAPLRGLASIEALYVAFHLLKKEKGFLLENYYWKKEFLEKNSSAWS